MVHITGNVNGEQMDISSKRKSSYSDFAGHGSCVEVGEVTFKRKASYSQGTSNCVEVGHLICRTCKRKSSASGANDDCVEVAVI